MRARVIAALAFFALVQTAAAAEDEAHRSWLAQDVIDDSGIAFVHASYRSGSGRDGLAFYEATAGGACWGDYDNDGMLDLYLTDFLDGRGLGGSRLYRAVGGDPSGAWRFVDATEATRAGRSGVGQACVWGDYDNDGWQDLYVTFAVTPFSHQRNVLLRNLGSGGGFEDVTARAGVTGDATHEGSAPCNPVLLTDEGAEIPRCWSVSAAWLDYDMDGDLDLYVANYAQFPFGSCVHEFRASPVFCLGQPNRLYRNEGDGTFRDVAREAGVDVNGQRTLGRSLGVVATDIDGDAWPDLYVANDKDANALYLNNRDGTFRSVASALGVDNFGPLEARDPEHRAGMGLDAQDFDNDGRVDLLSTHLQGEFDGLYRNTGEGWEDVALAMGIRATGLDVSRWGGGFVDFDLDGWKDFLVVSGDQARGRGGPIHLFLQREGHFVAVDDAAWPFRAEHRANHRAAAFADYDNDGDWDVLASTLPDMDGAPSRPKLLRFEAPLEHRSLRVHLVGTDGARDAIGARVTVTTGDGFVQHQWKASGGSYAGNNDPRLLFGLGNATRGTIEVVWPGGARQGPIAFDLGERRLLETTVTEENLRAPPRPAFAPDALRREESGARHLAWLPSLAADFAAYHVYQGETRIAQIFERGATRFPIPDLAEGSVFRLRVVDSAGHESEAALLDAAPPASRAAAPALPTLAVAATVALAAIARRFNK